MFSVFSFTWKAISARRRMASGREVERHAFGGEQRLVLLHLAGVGARQDALEVVDRQRVELDADRKAPLQLRDQVRGLGEVERAATR